MDADAKKTTGKLAAACALLAVIYGPTFAWMYERFTETDSYYSHGFLIPFVVGFLVWRKRDALKTVAVPDGEKTGAAWLAAGLLGHLLGAWWEISFVSGFSLVPVLIGLTGLFFGRNAMRAVFFPLVFLVFMVPIPMVMIASLSYGLKIAATRGALVLVHRVGVPAVMRGSRVLMPDAALLVGDVCSGLRSLISLLALGALFAYAAKLSTVKKVVLFLAAAPIAVAVNSVRIFLLCLVAEVYGTKTATGWFHDLSGLLLFVLAFLALEAVAKSLEVFRARGA